MNWSLVLLVVAIILFVLDFMGVSFQGKSLLPLGLAFFAASFLPLP